MCKKQFIIIAVAALLHCSVIAAQVLTAIKCQFPPLPSPLTPLPFVHILLAVHAGAAFVSHASSALNAHRAAQSAHILKWHLHLGQFDGAVIKATRLIPLRLDSPQLLSSTRFALSFLFLPSLASTCGCLVSPCLA